MVITYSKGKGQTGKTASPARRGHLGEQEKWIISCSRSPLRLWSRVSLLISILRLNMVLTYEIPPESRGGVHLLSIQMFAAARRCARNSCTRRPSYRVLV